MSKEAKKILLALTGGLGDALISLPIIRRIQDEHPNARIYLIYEHRGGKGDAWEALEHLELFETAFSIQPNASGGYTKRSVLALWGRLIAHRFDKLYYITSCTRSAKTLLRDKLFFMLSGISRMSGLEPLDSRQLFPKDDAGAPQEMKHELFWRMERLGFESCGDNNAYLDEIDYPLPASTLRKARSILGDVSFMTVAIAPMTASPSKNWSVERWAAVVEHIEAQGYRIICVGSEQERQFSEQILDKLESGINVCGELSFLETGAVLSLCRMYVGLDAALSHLAALLGTESVVLFSGQSHPGQWWPLAGEEDLELLTHPVRCAGCAKSDCPIEGHPCMTEISAKAACAAIDRILEV